MFIQGQWKTKYMAVENVEWLFLPFKTQRKVLAANSIVYRQSSMHMLAR